MMGIECAAETSWDHYFNIPWFPSPLNSAGRWGNFLNFLNSYFLTDRVIIEESAGNDWGKLLGIASNVYRMKLQYHQLCHDNLCTQTRHKAGDRRLQVFRIFMRSSGRCVNVYEVYSISSRTEFFALVRSVVTTPAAGGVIPKVSWASLLKASFLCASCMTLL